MDEATLGVVVEAAVEARVEAARGRGWGYHVSRDRISTTIVARFHYRHEAEMAHGYLESAGVNSILHIDDAGGMDVGLAFVNPARIVVRVEDEERARQVLVDAGMLEAPDTP